MTITNRINILTLILAISSMFYQPSVMASNDEPKAKCTSTKLLYSGMDISARINAITPIDSAVLLSPHYCVGFVHKRSDAARSTKITASEVLALKARYKYAWSSLSDSDKVTFSHLYLKQLSKKHLILPTTRVENEIAILIPSIDHQGGTMFLKQLVNVQKGDYTLVESGLIELSMIADDKELTDNKSIKKLIKWVIEGGDLALQTEQIEPTLLPSGPNYYCTDCEWYSIDQLRTQGGVGGVSYDVDWYFTYGYSYNVDDGIAWENEQCSVHNDCEAVPYLDEWEECVMVVYNDNHIIYGLYCEPFDL